MTYPFVAAAYNLGRRDAPVLAMAIHMAEGGGTVGYLSRPNPNRVSVHYVIERTGRTVQMLREDTYSGSINPRDIRQTNDPAYTDPTGERVTYGYAANRTCLGTYWRDPNKVVISVEVEGFAATGPNAAQHAALVALVADVRTRYPGLPVLGHRDWADYKACPGKLIRWGDLGGHGRHQEVDTVSVYTRTERRGTLTIAAGATVRGWKMGPAGPEEAKRLTPTATTSAPFRATLARISGSASPSSLLEVSEGYFAGLYVSTAEVAEDYAPVASVAGFAERLRADLPAFIDQKVKEYGG